MYQGLCKLNNGIYNILKIIIICLLIVMSISVFAQVIFRYVLKSPISWSEEITTYLFSWLTYCGAAVVLKNNGHVNVSTLVENIKNKRIRKVVILFSQLLMLGFLMIVLYYSVDLVSQLMINDQRLLNIESIPVAYFFLQVPISGLAMGLIMVEKIIATWNTNDKDVKEQVERMEGGVE